MQLNDIDIAIIKVFSIDNAPQSAYSLRKLLEKSLNRKLWVYSISFHCEKLVGFNFLKKHKTDKGGYYTLNEKYAIAVNDTVFVSRNDLACPMYCPFFGPKNCTLWDSLPENIKKSMKKHYRFKTKA